MIDHIRLATGHKRVFYVGYSLGGTVFFVACSSRPAVNEKIRAGVVIAPYMFTPVHLNKVLQLTIRIIFSVMVSALEFYSFLITTFLVDWNLHVKFVILVY